MQIALYISYLVFLLSSCGITSGQAETPQPVPRIVYEIYPNEWYLAQQKIWKREIEKNPRNAEAWHNYYNAVRYARFEETIDTPSKKERLSQIIRDMEQAIPDSYELYLLRFKTEADFGNIDLIRKAHQLRPDAAEPYYDLIVDAEINGNRRQVHQYYEKLHTTRDIPQWLLDYNYNVLMSLKPNAILFTNGDNDTYPIRMLQEVFAVRRDVLVMNINLSAIKGYFTHKLTSRKINFDYADFHKVAFHVDSQRGKQFSHSRFIQKLCEELTAQHPDIPLYFGLTVYKAYYNSLKEDLYIVGLAYRYSKKRMDNLALLKKHFERDFRLDYLQHDWYADLVPGKRLRVHTHLNYAPPAIMLADHYQQAGESYRAEYWYRFALARARDVENDDMIREIQKKLTALDKGIPGNK